MTRLQRILLVLVALVITAVSIATAIDGYFEGVSWLLPVLAVGAILFIAAHGLEIKDVQLPKRAKNPPPQAAPHPIDEDTGGQSKRSFDATCQLAEKLHDAIEASAATLTADIEPASPGADSLRLAYKWRFHESRIETLLIAYTLHGFVPGRVLKAIPQTEVFKTYQRLVRQKLSAFIRERDQFFNSLTTTQIPLPKSEGSAEERATRLMLKADLQRIEASQTSELEPLIRGALASPALSHDPNLAPTIARIIVGTWDVDREAAQKIAAIANPRAL